MVIQDTIQIIFNILNITIIITIMMIKSNLSTIIITNFRMKEKKEYKEEKETLSFILEQEVISINLTLLTTL